MGEPAADFGHLMFGDSNCPACGSGQIEVVATFGSPPDESAPETQLGRCGDCGESLRREASTVTAGLWQITGF